MKDGDEVQVLKTCMGSRCTEIEEERWGYERKRYRQRLVYWDDGTYWKEENGESEMPIPRPAEEGELWVADAVAQFKEVLAGRKTEFSIHFADGRMFDGRLVDPQHRKRYPGANIL